MIIYHSKQAELLVTRALASHFKIKYADLALDMNFYKQRDGLDRMLYSADLEDKREFDYHIYACQVTKLDLNTLLDMEKFCKSDIYAQFKEGLGMKEPGTPYMMALCLKGTVWVLREDLRRRGYQGLGGIYFGTGDEGFIIEPIKNMLKHEHPSPLCE